MNDWDAIILYVNVHVKMVHSRSCVDFDLIADPTPLGKYSNTGNLVLKPIEKIHDT